MTGAERTARWRQRLRAAGMSGRSEGDRTGWERFQSDEDYRVADAPRRRAGKRRKRLARPFVGIDGEGAGTDAQGRQEYRLMASSTADGEGAELFTGQPLSTAECLRFILDQPADAVLVGFFFSYDVTMICRDLTPDRRAHLLRPKQAGEGKSRYTWVTLDGETFGLEYLARNYFRVARIEQGRSVKGSARTVYDCHAFFQSSFVKAIEAWDVGTGPERAAIAADKARRADFADIGAREREYCALECRLLADMMERFKTVCQDIGLIPRTWNGAGKLAAALHEQHETPTRAQLAELIPSDVLHAAGRAYYGGRFEVTHHGSLAGPVHEYDIASAYPAAMLGLPCLLHGGWERVSGPELAALPVGSLYVADVAFRHPKGAPLCGLPLRLKDGRLTWPREGAGTYWSAEIDAARELGCVPTFRFGFRYVKACQCQTFSWVADLYAARLKIGKSGKGIVLKLGINSLYGKLAQRVGNPKWANLIWAGLITAATRAKLIRAAACDPGAVVMMATDGIYSTRPLPLPEGRELGMWEHAELPRLFILQPGVYWGKSLPKTRGVPVALFGPHTARIEAEWAAWAAEQHDRPPWAMPNEFPRVPVPLTQFIGLKLAQARGKPDLAGTWLEGVRRFNFSPHPKRAGPYSWDGNCLLSRPPPGGPALVSYPHRGLPPDELDALDAAKLDFEEMPDPVDLLPHTG